MIDQIIMSDPLEDLQSIEYNDLKILACSFSLQDMRIALL